MRAVKRMGRGMVERYGTRPGREMNQPAFTIRASAGGMEPGGFAWEDGESIERMTVEQAAAFQSYPPLFQFAGSKTSAFLQVGNAVPPLIADTIFRHIWKGDSMTDYTKHAVLDLFAGHGFGCTLKKMGVTEYAVEFAPDARATRAANGMDTEYENAWDMHLAEGLEFDTLIGGPPCPSFSMAGAGSGRRQMNEVLGAIDDGRYSDIAGLREWASTLDDERTGLVLVPLAYIFRFGPTFVVLEQVPPVLPIWKAYARVLESWGYSVWTDVVRMEQYGVPQTRKRAFLIARRDGKTATPPPVTHSRYHERTPEKLDAGVLPWVSMAEAIGNAVEGRPSPTVTGGCDDWRMGAVRPGGSRGNQAFAVVSNYGSGGDSTNRGRRMSDQPAATITSKFDRMRKEWVE